MATLTVILGTLLLAVKLVREALALINDIRQNKRNRYTGKHRKA